ncbi:MAG: endonuclease domain-containing protein [Planctomycetota bacterium]
MAATIRTHKTCRVCGETKPVESFEKKDAQGRRRSACKECRRPIRAARERRRYLENPQALEAKRSRDRNRERQRHGMWAEERKALYASQQGLCAACGKEEATQVDHDHACCPGSQGCKKCVRGMLCGTCNSVLGYARDSVETLKACIVYLESH